MAASLKSIPIPGKSSVDLYAATGITVGIKLTVQNTGNQKLRISESNSEPNLSVIGSNTMNPGAFLQSADVPIGVWVTNTNVGASTVQVEEA